MAIYAVASAAVHRVDAAAPTHLNPTQQFSAFYNVAMFCFVVHPDSPHRIFSSLRCDVMWFASGWMQTARFCQCFAAFWLSLVNVYSVFIQLCWFILLMFIVYLVAHLITHGVMKSSWASLMVCIQLFCAKNGDVLHPHVFTPSILSLSPSLTDCDVKLLGARVTLKTNKK